MRPPRPIWLNLPLTQKGRYSTGILLGNGACTRRRRSCSWLLDHISWGVEDRKRIEEDRKKEAENRLREKELELELARLNVNSDNERTGEGCNTLDALMKSVRILAVKVPNRPEVKVILDSGCTSNFLTRNLCDLIGLKKYKANVSVWGLNKTVIPIDSLVSVSISNKEGSYIKTLDFFSVPTITEDLVPTTKIDFNLNNIPNIKLADKNFSIPERVQMLLGAEVFYELMLPGQFKTEGSNVIFQNTVFGFIVSGSTSSDAKGKEHCGFIQAADNLEHSIKKFWEIENVEIDSVKTSELDICEDHFKSTHSRDDQGRYTVAMPLKENRSCLGESRQTAIQRLNSLWKRLSRDKEYLSLYEKFLQEYEDLGHMREIKADGSEVSFYMPHHGVYRPEKVYN
ncbi:integrase catalytic domain-containing protein [Trichonephila clavipes]|nr:integrase catalytic domain-containing protein [Trichonephila clavipes]